MAEVRVNLRDLEELYNMAEFAVEINPAAWPDGKQVLDRVDFALLLESLPEVEDRNELQAKYRLSVRALQQVLGEFGRHKIERHECLAMACIARNTLEELEESNK